LRKEKERKEAEIGKERKREKRSCEYEKKETTRGSRRRT